MVVHTLRFNCFSLWCADPSLAPLGPQVWCWWWGWLWWLVITCGPWPGGCSCSWFLLPHLRISLGLVLLCLLTCSYAFLFLHSSAALCYIQTYYIRCLLGMVETISVFSFLLLYPVLSSSRSAFLYLTMGELFIAGGVCIVKPVPHLVSPIPVLLYVSTHLKSFAKIPVLYFSIVHYYNRLVKPG